MSLSSWNFTIQDNSPVVTYAPFADGGLAGGWQPWYSKSGFLKTPGEGGDGDSYHISSHPNASFSLQFHGTGVNLYGTTNTSYAVFIDGQEQKVAAVADDLVFQKAGLTDGAHSLTLSVNPAKATEKFAFDRAVVFSPVKTLPTPAFYDNSDPRLTYGGTWKSANAPGIPNATVTHDFQQTRTSGSSVSMTFSGAVGVAINGPVLWGDWVYSVDLDGTKTKYNASTFWKVPDALRFFQAGLDPNSSHTITLANPSDQMTLSLNSFTLFKVPGAADVAQSASGSATSKSSSASATVGSSESAGGSTAPTDSAAGSTSASDAAPSTTGTGGAAKASVYCLTIASVLACSAFLLI
ncbi:hypothetical protein DFH08DRAFT_326438 [Mycena albidolilacea]|uniref:Uncharacterized protein n=1 Tax=Mycena albidolilacea TaxID=1033008 RepID=A0AAD7AMJ3_9AGAR|nr:hypothetical protein DFH08DRAFT_326438 [Mycena albidolilacea]